MIEDENMVSMFDEQLEKDPQLLSFEETYENLDLLKRKLDMKLKEKGLDPKDFEIVSNQYYGDNQRKSQLSLHPHLPPIHNFQSRNRLDSHFSSSTTANIISQKPV